MTKVIVLNHYPVLPALNGGQATVQALTRELALFWPTELVWTQRRTAYSHTMVEPDRQWTVTIVPNLRLQRKVGRWLRHLTGQIEADACTMLFSGTNRLLIEHLRSSSQDGDIFYLAHPWLWPAVREVLRHRRAVVVYDAHNVEYLLKQQVLRPSSVTRWLVERTRRLEAELVARADLTLACTARDADELSRLAQVRRDSLIIGLRGVQPSPRADAIARERRRRTPGQRALFVGSKHPPNDQAAKWIIEYLAPRMPDWQFDIAGACGPGCEVVPSTPNVNVLGIVEDLGALMADADVGLNPMMTGSGVNMKLFEYLQHGLPVVSTPFGTRGLEATGPNGVLAARLDEFAPLLAALDQDVPWQHELSALGTACVQRHFTWPVVGARLRARVAELLLDRRIASSQGATRLQTTLGSW